MGEIIAGLLSSKFWWHAERGEFERLERQIISIREKLNEPLESSPVHAIREVCDRIEALSAGSWDKVKPLAKSILESWGMQPGGDASGRHAAGTDHQV